MTEGQAKNVAILGSTGSIGRSALEVIRASGGRLRLVALSAHTRLTEAIGQCREFQPRWLVATSPMAAAAADFSNLPASTECRVGVDELERMAGSPDIDIVVSAIVGIAGLRGTLAALAAGKRVALANKESLVVAGSLVMRSAREKGGKIIPVDSEHSALFQAMAAGRRDEVQRIILTASGGPFLRHTPEQLARVTVDQALAHPTWKMGPKITIDSATMLNKALEIIEARWLFDLPPEKIQVMIHPQSVVHSMVEFRDGAVIAQLSPPDMKLPIQYALHFPERVAGVAHKMDWTQRMRLDFEPPDPEQFPAVELGLEVARAGGTAGAVLNAAKEAAVDGFISGNMAFHEIVPACRAVVQHHTFDAAPDLDRLWELDAWAREEVNRWVCTS